MKSATYLFIVILISTVLIEGCERQKFSKRSELQDLLDGPQGRYSDMWRGTFYCGTKEGYHYLLHKMEFCSDLWIMIPTNELIVLDPFPLTKEKNKFVDISRLKAGEIVKAKSAGLTGSAGRVSR